MPEGHVILWAKTAVSRFYLPPETLDYITDFLHDKPEIFNECSLVSKSWVPRARKYLPAEINLSHPHFPEVHEQKKLLPNRGRGRGGGMEWGVLHVKAAVLIRSSAVAKRHIVTRGACTVEQSEDAGRGSAETRVW